MRHAIAVFIALLAAVVVAYGLLFVASRFGLVGPVEIGIVLALAAVAGVAVFTISRHLRS
ncbi:hypothetical protein [Sphaerimonospora thailandensis]|uniref:Uncharacterized protein n=1 Tax=Sphaerimonospora thailandensis TaxID=795644 RepID=A0A8J3W304_9ACTN|nr:hypothetical protein [Sphaerimonospora thailandensis]GIH73336.1 hypothetical protein Mth01_55890 [Sphaerimonospora thailandensis]